MLLGAIQAGGRSDCGSQPTACRMPLRGLDCIATHAPGEVLVNARPVQTERKAEQQLFGGYAVQQPASKCGQVPDRSDVAGREPLQSQHETGVQGEEQKPQGIFAGVPGDTNSTRRRSAPGRRAPCRSDSKAGRRAAQTLRMATEVRSVAAQGIRKALDHTSQT
jgi:hypothetical protein